MKCYNHFKFEFDSSLEPPSQLNGVAIRSRLAFVENFSDIISRSTSSIFYFSVSMKIIILVAAAQEQIPVRAIVSFSFQSSQKSIYRVCMSVGNPTAHSHCRLQG